MPHHAPRGAGSPSTPEMSAGARSLCGRDHLLSATSLIRPGSWNEAKAWDGSPGNLRDPAHAHARASRQSGRRLNMDPGPEGPLRPSGRRMTKLGAKVPPPPGCTGQTCPPKKNGLAPELRMPYGIVGCCARRQRLRHRAPERGNEFSPLDTDCHLTPPAGSCPPNVYGERGHQGPANISDPQVARSRSAMLQECRTRPTCCVLQQPDTPGCPLPFLRQGNTGRFPRGQKKWGRYVQGSGPGRTPRLPNGVRFPGRNDLGFSRTQRNRISVRFVTPGVEGCSTSGYPKLSWP
jgi:hypothetical protein